MIDQPCLTAAEWAERLSGTLHGDGNRVIRSVATLQEAGPDALSWAATPAFVAKIAEAQAGAVIIGQDASPPEGCTTIRVADPELARCEVLEWFSPPVDQVPPGVHATAVVADDASIAEAAIGAHVYVGNQTAIGARTQVHPGCYVGNRVTIGQDCVLWPSVVVREGTILGDRVIIHPNTTIGADGFGYLQRDGGHRKIPQVGTVVIDEDVEIGANCTVDRARSGVTHIGRGTKIDNLVQIGHNVDIGEHCVIVAQCAIGGSATLGRYVTLAGQCGVRDHRHIGNGTTVLAKSAVLCDVGDGEVVGGIPAIEQQRFLRATAALHRLDEWGKRLRDLLKRVERLESAGEERK